MKEHFEKLEIAFAENLYLSECFRAFDEWAEKCSDISSLEAEVGEFVMTCSRNGLVVIGLMAGPAYVSEARLRLVNSNLVQDAMYMRFLVDEAAAPLLPSIRVTESSRSQLVRTVADRIKGADQSLGYPYYACFFIDRNNLSELAHELRWIAENWMDREVIGHAEQLLRRFSQRERGSTTFEADR